MSSKILKCQFNELCLAGLELKNNRAVMYSGIMKENLVEVTNNGVNIQTTGPGRITLNSTQIYGPGFMYVTSPADFVPFARIFAPKKTIAPVLEIMDDFRAINQFAAFVVLSGGVL